MRNINATLTIAYREIVKFLRDIPSLLGTLLIAVLFITVLGGTFQQNIGQAAGFNFLTFIFVGVLMQTLFTAPTGGIISLLEDRENDFTQEMLIAPISRYTIIFGKILGASFTGLVQGVAVIAVGLVSGVSITAGQIVALLPVVPLVCLLGGGFGVLLVSLFSNQRSANQILQVIFVPLFFLAGIFTPIRNLSLPLDIISHITPLRYAVDLGRGLFYNGMPEYSAVVLQSPFVNLIVIVAMFVVFSLVGTFLFVRNERNK